MAGKLTTVKVRALTQPGRYGDGDGLWLQVRDADRRSWLLRYMVEGRSREMGLGPLNLVTLAEAREAARAARTLLRDGRDPLDARQAERASARARAQVHTFREVAAEYISAHEASWRNAKHRAQWRSTLDTYACPMFGDRAVASITTDDVLKALRPIWQAKPETASRLRGRIETVLDYATARGWRAGDNPARWRGHIANLLPRRSKLQAVQHHPALPWQEVGAFMAALHEQPGMAALALRFLILTAARTGEALGARWSEIDLDAAVWTVPAQRMKAGREHRVPLSGDALAVLAIIRRAKGDADGFVFPGVKAAKPLSNMAMGMLLRRMGRPELTVHGFRSTFRDWAAEQTAYAREVAEAALAHTLRDKVEAAYRRGDLMEKRARLMADWAGYCARPATVAEVVPIRARG